MSLLDRQTCPLKRLLKISLLASCSYFISVSPARSQNYVTGRVFDSSGLYPLEAVSVLSSAGKGTSTAADGRYELSLGEKDSIWFSYLGKPTMKYPAFYVLSLPEFDISLKVSVTVLKEIKVHSRDYKLDSVQNRIDYARIFNYARPTFKSIVPSFGLGFTIDLDELIRAFQKKKIRTNLSFQRRLIQQEKDKFIDHRFTRPLVRKLTGLDGDELEEFMRRARPGYDFTLHSSDYVFREYILNCFRQYRMGAAEN